MAPIQKYDYYFPYFPSPPPHNFPSPPKVPPPPQPVAPPPPKYPVPAPPPHGSTKPPPPAAKPPSHSIPPPPPTPPGHHSTIIIVVFVSLGALFFLAFLSIALCCFIKKKKKKFIQETDTVKVDEHLKVQEAIIPGPHGAQVVVLSIDEDVHIEEEIKKNETVGISSEDHPQAMDMAASTSGTSHHHLDHNTN